MEVFIDAKRFIYDKSIAKAAGEHAKAEYPNESVGAVVEGQDSDHDMIYCPMENISDDPINAFSIGTRPSGTLHAIIHSHTLANSTCPSRTDMMGQQAMAVPWGILHSDGEIYTDIQWFGDQIPVAPLIGRQFISGHHDCWSLVRDVYREQFGITLENYPHSEDWFVEGEDMHLMDHSNIIPGGFVRIEKADLRTGDVVLGRVGRTGVSNHCGIISGNGTILHQLGNGSSRREVLGPWLKYIMHAIRHKHFVDNPDIIPEITFGR